MKGTHLINTNMSQSHHEISVPFTEFTSTNRYNDNGHPRKSAEKLMEEKVFKIQKITNTFEDTWIRVGEGETGEFSLNDDLFYKTLYEQMKAMTGPGLQHQEYDSISQQVSRSRYYKFFGASTIAGATVSESAMAIAGAGMAGAAVAASVATFGATAAASGLVLALIRAQQAVVRNDSRKHAQLHIARSRLVSQIIMSHLDKTVRLYKSDMPVRLPGQTDEEYKDDMRAYTSLMREIISTIMEGNILIHLARVSKKDGKNAIWKGDARSDQFSEVLRALLKNNEDLKVIAENLRKSSKSAFDRGAFVKLIAEVDSNLQNYLDDFHLLVSVRNAEGMRAMESDMFGFRDVSVEGMTNERDERSMEALVPRVLVRKMQGEMCTKPKGTLEPLFTFGGGNNPFSQRKYVRAKRSRPNEHRPAYFDLIGGDTKA